MDEEAPPIPTKHGPLKPDDTKKSSRTGQTRERELYIVAKDLIWKMEESFQTWQSVRELSFRVMGVILEKFKEENSEEQVKTPKVKKNGNKKKASLRSALKDIAEIAAAVPVGEGYEKSTAALNMIEPDPSQEGADLRALCKFWCEIVQTDRSNVEKLTDQLSTYNVILAKYDDFVKEYGSGDVRKHFRLMPDYISSKKEAAVQTEMVLRFVPMPDSSKLAKMLEDDSCSNYDLATEFGMLYKRTIAPEKEQVKSIHLQMKKLIKTVHTTVTKIRRCQYPDEHGSSHLEELTDDLEEELLEWFTGRKRCCTELETIIKQLNKSQAKTNKTRKSGKITYSVGYMLDALGSVLVPITFGGSIGIMAVGLSLTVAGHSADSAALHVHKKLTRGLVRAGVEAIEADQLLVERIVEMLEDYKACIRSCDSLGLNDVSHLLDEGREEMKGLKIISILNTVGVKDPGAAAVMLAEQMQFTITVPELEKDLDGMVDYVKTDGPNLIAAELELLLSKMYVPTRFEINVIVHAMTTTLRNATVQAVQKEAAVEKRNSDVDSNSDNVTSPVFEDDDSVYQNVFFPSQEPLPPPRFSKNEDIKDTTESSRPKPKPRMKKSQVPVAAKRTGSAGDSQTSADTSKSLDVSDAFVIEGQRAINREPLSPTIRPVAAPRASLRKKRESETTECLGTEDGVGVTDSFKQGTQDCDSSAVSPESKATPRDRLGLQESPGSVSKRQQASRDTTGANELTRGLGSAQDMSSDITDKPSIITCISDKNGVVHSESDTKEIPNIGEEKSLGDISATQEEKPENKNSVQYDFQEKNTHLLKPETSITNTNEIKTSNANSLKSIEATTGEVDFPKTGTLMGSGALGLSHKPSVRQILPERFRENVEDDRMERLRKKMRGIQGTLKRGATLSDNEQGDNRKEKDTSETKHKENWLEKDNQEHENNEEKSNVILKGSKYVKQVVKGVSNKRRKNKDYKNNTSYVSTDDLSKEDRTNNSNAHDTVADQYHEQKGSTTEISDTSADKQDGNKKTKGKTRSFPFISKGKAKGTDDSSLNKKESASDSVLPDNSVKEIGQTEGYVTGSLPPTGRKGYAKQVMLGFAAKFNKTKEQTTEDQETPSDEFGLKNCSPEIKQSTESLNSNSGKAKSGHFKNLIQSFSKIKKSKSEQDIMTDSTLDIPSVINPESEEIPEEGVAEHEETETKRKSYFKQMKRGLSGKLKRHKSKDALDDTASVDNGDPAAPERELSSSVCMQEQIIKDQPKVVTKVVADNKTGHSQVKTNMSAYESYIDDRQTENYPNHGKAAPTNDLQINNSTVDSQTAMQPCASPISPDSGTFSDVPFLSPSHPEPLHEEAQMTETHKESGKSSLGSKLTRLSLRKKKSKSDKRKEAEAALAM